MSEELEKCPMGIDTVWLPCPRCGAKIAIKKAYAHLKIYCHRCLPIMQQENTQSGGCCGE